MKAETTVTFPVGNISTLTPLIAFAARPHDGVRAIIRRDGKAVWESGDADTRECYLQPPELAPLADYTVTVSVRTSDGWGEWSSPAAFRTPGSPIVRILSPRHAGTVIGPSVHLEWEVEAATWPAGLSVELDGEQLGSIEQRVGAQSAAVSLEGGLHALRVTAEGGRTAAAEAAFVVWNSPQFDGDLVLLDLSEVSGWDVVADADAALRMYDLLHAAGCLQGIVNRDAPRLMLRLYDQDDFWLEWLRESGRWLESARLITLKTPGKPEEALMQAVEMFRGFVNGLVVWDRDVAATSNVATTAAGVEDLLPVRSDTGPGSLRERLAAAGLAVKLDLAGMFDGRSGMAESGLKSTGSAKCDAYIWAKERYLDSGRCNGACLGYWVDSFWLRTPGRQPWHENCLSNHDWITANRGFLFDLSNWGDEAPQDDPGQPVGTDLETFKSVLLSAREQSPGRMVHVSGFTPWAFKYTTHAESPGSHEPVASEWEMVRVLSAYDAYLDADAHGLSAMANASLWRHMPAPDHYVQNPPPTKDDLRKRGYLTPDDKISPLGYTLFYIGDYDSAAWLYRRLPLYWEDHQRGQVPMGWAINPNLSLRMPVALHYAYSTASAMDFFTSGDSGAGYVNPTMLLEPRPISGLPPGDRAWVSHCRELFQKFGIRIAGFLINGHAGRLSRESLEMTARFSPDGTATQAPWMPEEGCALFEGMPLALQQHDLCPDNEANLLCMNRFREEGLQFLNFRLVLLGPSFVDTLTQLARASRLDAPYEMVDPLTFYYLLRHHLGGRNERRATVSCHTLPEVFRSGSSSEVVIGLRNDGWDTWEAGRHFVRTSFRKGEEIVVTSKVGLEMDVCGGAALLQAVRLDVPEQPGEYNIAVEVDSPDESYADTGDLLWHKLVRVDP